MGKPPRFGDNASVITFLSRKISFTSMVMGKVPTIIPRTTALFPFASKMLIVTEWKPGNS